MPDSKELAIARKFYDEHPEILVCDENSETILRWLDDNCLAFSLNNLNEAAEALGNQLVRKYSDEEIQRMTGNEYKRNVMPYCSDLSEEHRNQLKPRSPDPIELLSSAEIRDQIVIPEWKARQTASVGQ